jgi:transposase-like protein
MPAPGRGKVACTPDKARQVLFMVARGTTVKDAARALGMSDNAIYRRALRDSGFRRDLTAALLAYPMQGRRPSRRSR